MRNASPETAVISHLEKKQALPKWAASADGGDDSDAGRAAAAA